MEIWAKNDESLENIELGKNYGTMEILYAVLVIISVVLTVMSKNLYFMALAVISLLGFLYMHKNNEITKPKQYEMEDCYINLSDNYLSYKQLVNGKYQEGKVYIKDINKIMKVEEGFQLWIDENSENSIITLDDDEVNINTVCISYYGYDSSDYIDLYLEFIDKLDDDIEKDLDLADWKREDNKNAWIKLFIPGLLYVFPILLIYIKG